MEEDDEKYLVCNECNQPIIKTQSDLNNESSRHDQQANEILCRICMCDNDTNGPLPQNFCDCQGSIGYVHLHCLERWLNQSQHEKCEICRKKYNIKRELASFDAWLKSPFTSYDRKMLVTDLVCLVIISPMSIFSTYLCLQAYISIPESIQPERWGFLVTGLLISFLTVGWIVLGIVYHTKVILTWRKRYGKIKVIG